MKEGTEAETTETQIPGDRGIPSINRTRSLQSRMSSVMAVALMSVLGLGLLGWYYTRTFTRPAQVQQNAQAQARSPPEGDLPLPALGRIEPPAPPTAAADPVEESAEDGAKGNTASEESLAAQLLGPPPQLPPAQILPPYDTTQSVPADQVKTPEQLALERRLSGPPFATVSTSATSEPTTTPQMSPLWPMQAAGMSSEGPQASPIPGQTGIDSLLIPGVTAAASARLLPTKRLLLAKGAFIDCTLETAIDSTLPGMTTCITATDTFSVDGKVVLLERGTKLIGETRGEVRHGSSRIFVLWNEARTPTGVIVPLASPGTDALGRSGLQGEVNRHFLERFGAAILISVIDGAIQAATRPEGEGGGTVIYSSSTTQDIATEALKSTINIPPTVTVAHGERIQVLVARDLDFRSVYELRATPPEALSGVESGTVSVGNETVPDSTPLTADGERRRECEDTRR